MLVSIAMPSSLAFAIISSVGITPSQKIIALISTDDIIAKANEEGIAILTSTTSSIATAREIIKHEG